MPRGLSETVVATRAVVPCTAVEMGHAPDRGFHFFPGGAVDLGATASMDVHVDEPRRDQHVAQVDRGGALWGRPATNLAYRTALDDDEAVRDDLVSAWLSVWRTARSWARARLQPSPATKLAITRLWLGHQLLGHRLLGHGLLGHRLLGHRPAVLGVSSGRDLHEAGGRIRVPP